MVVPEGGAKGVGFSVVGCHWCAPGGALWQVHYYTRDFDGSVDGTEDVLVAALTCDRAGSGDAFVAGELACAGVQWTPALTPVLTPVLTRVFTLR